jgi:transcriptional regulator with XRE-family HTH domain
MSKDRMTKEELRAWRVRRGLTQQALSELLGVAAITLRSWENDRRPVPLWIDAALVGAEVKMAAMKAGGNGA